MLSMKLALTVALAAAATVALANGAMAQYGAYYFHPHAWYGRPVMPMLMSPSYVSYVSYSPGYYGSYSPGYYGGYYGSYYYGSRRYSGPYRTDSAPLSGGGY